MGKTCQASMQQSDSYIGQDIRRGDLTGSLKHIKSPGGDGIFPD